MATPTLIFEHVPKAAGSTINGILQSEYEEEFSFWIDGNDPSSSISRFRQKSEFERSQYRLIAGHNAYRLYTDVPSPRISLTFLRNPVARIISHYYYAQSQPNHYLYEEARSLTLQEYVSGNLSVELSDNYTYRFSEWGRDRFESDPEGAFLAARKNLIQDFDLVGIVEHFDESILLASDLFNWRLLPFYTRKNVSRSRPSRKKIDDETLKSIKSFNELDIQIYSFFRQRLENALRSRSSMFEWKLQLFKNLNVAWSFIMKLA